jgi:hypothetical protein
MNLKPVHDYLVDAINTPKDETPAPKRMSSFGETPHFASEADTN